MKQTNFHTHTSRCHHAFGNDEEFVRTAIQNGFEVLGFSDHACWKYDSDFVAHMRMKLDEFDDYKDSVLYLKDRYKKQIEIRFGLEAEYFPKYMDWLLDFCIENEIDYLILAIIIMVQMRITFTWVVLKVSILKDILILVLKV